MKKLIYSIVALMLFTQLVWAEEPLGPPIALDSADETQTVVVEEKAEPESPKEEKVIGVVYVTDKLILGMKDNPEGTGKNLKLLRSGTRLEVLERDGPFSKVRTPEGLVGWAKTTFMVKDKPAILVAKEQEDEIKALRKEIDELKKGVTREPEKIVEIQTDPQQKQRVIELEMALDEAKKQLEEKEEQLTHRSYPTGNTEKISTSFKLILIALLAGFTAGLGVMFFYFQQRMRKRFAGMKV